MNQLPEELRLTSNVLPDEQRKRFEQGYIANNVAPQIAQLQASLFKNGRADSSFGGAQMGQMQAQGAYQGMMAGEQLYQNHLDQLLAKRASFFGNEVANASQSNLADVNRGQQIADRSQQDNQFQNSFNLDAYRANIAAQGNWHTIPGSPQPQQGGYGGYGGGSTTQGQPRQQQVNQSNAPMGYVRSGVVNTPSIDGLVHSGGGNGWYY